MSIPSKALKRFGVAGVGAVIALGTSAVGFTGVAAADNPAAIQFTAPTTGTGSTLGDGTNTMVKLSVVQTATNVGVGNPALTSVRFDYTQTKDASGNAVAGTETAIGTAATSPYTLEWTPPASGTYTLTAEPLTTGGGSAGSVAQETGVVVTATYPSVHITTPADGATIPYFTTRGERWISVAGTRSNGADGLPQINVDTSLYDMTNPGDVINSATDSDAVSGNATPGAGASQAWSAAVPVPTDACPASDTCAVVVHAVASDEAGTSDEAVQATLGAAQTLSPTGLGVAPTGTVTITDSTSGTGTDTTSQTYTVTATDTNGKPIAGLTVLAYGNSATDTINGSLDPTAGSPASRITDANGQATFTASDSADQTSTLTFETAVNGESYSAANDDLVTRSLVTTAHVDRVLAKVTLTETPSQSVYASQSYTSSYPVVSACLTDQFGSPFHSTSALIGLDTRTEGNTVTNPTVSFGTEEQTSSVNNGCFPVVLSSYPGDSTQSVTGNDAITVYEEVNGQNGFQSGSTDIGAQTTVDFAPGSIAFDTYADCTNATCITQAQTGTVKTITVKETVGGNPLAGQTLALSIGGNASFPATQPSGTTVANGNNQAASCTTDAAGTCQVNVSDATTQSEELEATDTHGLEGEIDVEFRSEPLTLTTAERFGHTTLYPVGDGSTDAEDYGTPGTIMVDTYHLFDGSDHILSDVPVTVSINHGFFTAVPTDIDLDGSESSGDYNTGTFDPAPASGALAGTPKDIGTAVAGGGETLNLVSSKFGVITIAQSIGRDAAFDTNGEVLTDVKVANDGNTVDAGNPAGDSEADSDFTWTTDSSDDIGYSDNVPLGNVVPGGALNGTSDTIVAAPGETLSGDVTDTPYNDAPEFEECASNNSPCSGDALSFQVQLKDQFGNLVGAPTSVSDTTDNVDCSSLDGSYTGSGQQSFCSVFSNGAPTTATADTVTDTWNTQTTTFGTNPDSSPGAPALAAIVNDASSVTQTDSFTVDLYSVDLTNLSYHTTVAPALHNGAVKTGTTVHDEVTVDDQYGNPVQGLFVTFDQSGPGAGVDNRASDFTDENGTAADNFSSSVQGDATVTSDVYKDCFQFTGNEGGECSPSTTGGVPLSENVDTIGFDGVPTISVTPASKAGKHAVAISGVTRPGASVQLQAGIGAGTFVNVGSAQTADPDGGYEFVLNVSKTTAFRVVADTIQTSASRTATVTVVKKTAQKPTISVKALKGSNAGKVSVLVGTHPNDHGATVTYYRVKNGVAHVIGSGTAGPLGRAAHTFSFGLNAHVSIRAKVSAHGNQTAGTTVTKSVTTPKKK